MGRALLTQFPLRRPNSLHCHIASKSQREFQRGHTISKPQHHTMEYYLAIKNVSAWFKTHSEFQTVTKEHQTKRGVLSTEPSCRGTGRTNQPAPVLPPAPTPLTRTKPALGLLSILSPPCLFPHLSPWGSRHSLKTQTTTGFPGCLAWCLGRRKGSNIYQINWNRKVSFQKGHPTLPHWDATI